MVLLCKVLKTVARFLHAPIYSEVRLISVLDSEWQPDSQADCKAEALNWAFKRHVTAEWDKGPGAAGSQGWVACQASIRGQSYWYTYLGQYPFNQPEAWHVLMVSEWMQSKMQPQMLSNGPQGLVT